MSRALLRRSDRLVAGAVLVAILLVWLVLVGFDAIVAFADELDELGQGDYDLWAALGQTLLTLPRRAYDLYPTSAVIGCLIGLGGLAATSELTALRAAGLSKLRICAGAAATLLALTGAMVLSAETLGPWADQKAQSISVSAKTSDLAVARWSGLWAREGNTFLNAKSGRVTGTGPETRVELAHVELFELADDGRLQSLALAATAVHQRGRWTLHDVRRTVFHARSATTTTVAEEQWQSALKPELLSQSLKRPRALTTLELEQNIRYLERNHLDTGEFESAYWARFFYPLDVFALCLVAMPFAFGTLRDGGLGKRIFLGVVLGIVFFLLQKVAVDLSTVYRLDPRLGNALPPLVIAAGGWLWFRRQW